MKNKTLYKTGSVYALTKDELSNMLSAHFFICADEKLSDVFTLLNLSSNDDEKSNLNLPLTQELLNEVVEKYTDKVINFLSPEFDFCDEEDLNCTLSEIKYHLEKRYKKQNIFEFLIVGKLGRWNGIFPAYKTVKGLNGITAIGCDEVEISINDGRLNISGYHHDGLNDFEVYLLKEDYDISKIDSLIRNTNSLSVLTDEDFVKKLKKICYIPIMKGY